MKKVTPTNRIAGALEELQAYNKGSTESDNAQGVVCEKPRRRRRRRKDEEDELEEQLDFGGIDEPPIDDDDDDDDDDDEEEYMEELLEVATDERAALVDARIIYLRHPTDPDKMMMVAEVDEFLPPDFNLEGDEMWIGELIIRMRKGREGSKQRPAVPSPTIFKKRNFARKVKKI